MHGKRDGESSLALSVHTHVEVGRDRCEDELYMAAYTSNSRQSIISLRDVIECDTL